MNNFIKSVICLLVAVTVVQGCKNRTDQLTRNLIAQTYALAITDSNVFFSYVRENSLLFVEGGEWDTSVKRLGAMLVEGSLKTLQDSSVETTVYNIADNIGRPDLAPKVCDDMKKSIGDLMVTGIMLQSMPVIVRDVIRGDATAYQQSYFGIAASALDSSRTLMLPADWVAIKQMSYQLNAWMILQYAQRI